MAEAKPPGKREEKAPPKEYYEKVSKESREALVGAVPSITLGIIAAVLLWLFGHLIFIRYPRASSGMDIPFQKF